MKAVAAAGAVAAFWLAVWVLVAGLVAQPLIKGTGTVKVEKNSFILAKYRTYSWKTGKLIEDKYGDQPDYGAIADTIPAWQKGLIGQTVGKQINGVAFIKIIFLVVEKFLVSRFSSY